MTAKPPLVRIEGFSYWHPGAEKPILDGLSMQLAPGELVLLVGPSGSGKTTVALSLNGIVPNVLGGRAEGTVIVDGLEVANHTVAQMATRVGIIFQDPDSQLVTLNVRDELAFGPENLQLERAEILERLNESTRFVGLTDWSQRFVYELSGGEKQRVNVAATLAMRPSVLVLDEPTANLDPASAAAVWELIGSLRALGLTLLLIENRLDEHALGADRLLVLDHGRIRFDGPPREVLSTHGQAIMEELGLWVPQCSEVEILLRQRCSRSAPTVPLSVPEALDAYRGYRFTDHPLTNGWPPATRQANPVIRARRVSHVYGSGKVALHDASVEIRPNELLAVVGPNGSGKTTLVKHFVGLLKPTSGSVEVFGRDTRRVQVRELTSRIGFVFQFPEHQFVKDTVAEEVTFSLQVARVPDDEIHDRVREVLQLFELEGLEQRHPFSLSGGEKRRLSVAAAVIARPSVLILDEPTYAQDRRNTLRMMRSIVELLGEGDRAASALSIIMVTHDMRLVADYAHRSVVMRAGEIVFDGPVQDMFGDEELLRSANLEVPSALELIHALQARGQVGPSVYSVEGLLRAVV
jgi:energy-coupling factor transport system ATP-binding protein